MASTSNPTSMLLRSAWFLDSETVNYSLYSPSEDTVYDLKFPSASRSSNEILCSGSIHGWLIMSEWTKKQRFCDITAINYFLNPMTGDRISLPQLTGIIRWWSSASSDPTSSDYIVAIAQWSQLVFFRPSSHESWLPEGQHYNFIAFLKFHEDGKLYVMEINRAEYQIHVLVTDRLTREGKSKYQKIIVCKEKTIKAGSLSADRMAPVCYSAPSITWSSKGEFFVAWKRLRPKEHDKLPEFPIIYVLKTDDTSSCNPIWVNAMNDVGQDQVLLLSDLHSTLSPSHLCQS